MSGDEERKETGSKIMTAFKNQLFNSKKKDMEERGENPNGKQAASAGNETLPCRYFIGIATESR